MTTISRSSRVINVDRTVSCPHCGGPVPIPGDILHAAQKWQERLEREALHKRARRAKDPCYAQSGYVPKTHLPGKPGRCLCGLPVTATTIMAAPGETVTCTNCSWRSDRQAVKAYREREAYVERVDR